MLDREWHRLEYLRVPAGVRTGAGTDPATWLCIAAGVALLVVFYFVERGMVSPLIHFDIFRVQAFRVENFVLGIAMLVGIPVYFFASEYAQVALGKPPINASLVLLYFFIGFVAGRPSWGPDAGPNRGQSARS